MGKTIILTGGGTAGHVTPNMALIPLLLEQGGQPLQIVVFCKEAVIQGVGGAALGVAHGGVEVIRVHAVPGLEIAAVGAAAQNEVHAPVVLPLELYIQGASCISPGHPDGVEDCVHAGDGEADQLGAGDHLLDLFRGFDGRQAVPVRVGLVQLLPEGPAQPLVAVAQNGPAEREKS